MGTLLMLSAGLINGVPFFDFDTAGYYRSGMAVASGIGQRTLAKQPDTSGINKAAEKSGVQRSRIKLPHLSRSVYYGFFLYAGARLGTIWLCPILQALIAAYLIYLTWSVLCAGSGRGFFTVLLVMLATPLPYYSALL
ncbi:MAG TPA: hypothetical protein PLP17_17150, partial [Oligoflexia bacterium]|nr:hypothetical protein [Oligoflexia bacterium]